MYRFLNISDSMCRGETATPLWKISTRKYYQTACNKPFSKNLIIYPINKVV